jgi:hypothetical protein
MSFTSTSSTILVDPELNYSHVEKLSLAAVHEV